MGTDQPSVTAPIPPPPSLSLRKGTPWRGVEVGQTVIKDIEKLISDLQTYQIELEIQNEELRRSQTELKNSQDRFCKLFDFAPIGYIVLDQNGFVIDANNTISIMLGRKSDAIINKPFSQFVYPEDQTIFLAGFKSFYKNSINKTLEVRLKGQDNTSLFSRIEGRFVEFNDSFSDTVTERLLLNVTDISETKKAELALRKSEAEHRNFLNSLNDAVICSNMDGDIIFFNSCAESFFDCKAEDVLGTKVSRFCPEDLINEQQQLIHKVLDKGLVKPVKTERLKSDGTRLPVEMSLHLNVDDHGRPQGFNAVIRDISEGIRQEELIRSAQENVKQLSGLLPICAHCKKIRDDKGYWKQIESYLYEHSEAKFSHSICRDCSKKYYPDIDIYEAE